MLKLLRTQVTPSLKLLHVQVAFSKRVLSWGINQSTTITATNPALISAIETALHTTQHNDQTIAQNITASRIATMQNQVKKI